MAGVNMRLKPGGIRELHWHKETEWAYMLAGRARLTAVDAQGRNFIDDVGVGDLWNFPAGIPHSIQGLKEGCEFLLVFDNGSFCENETSSSPIGSRIRRARYWPRTFAYRNPLSPIFPRTSSAGDGFLLERCPDLLPQIR